MPVAEEHISRLTVGLIKVMVRNSSCFKAISSTVYTGMSFLSLVSFPKVKIFVGFFLKVLFI